MVLHLLPRCDRDRGADSVTAEVYVVSILVCLAAGFAVGWWARGTR